MAYTFKDSNKDSGMAFQEDANTHLLEEVKVLRPGANSRSVTDSFVASEERNAGTWRHEEQETLNHEPGLLLPARKMQVITKLTEMGFPARMCYQLVGHVAVSTVAEAVDFLIKTPRGWTHSFILEPHTRQCAICQETFHEHIEAAVLAADFESLHFPEDESPNTPLLLEDGLEPAPYSRSEEASKIPIEDEFCRICLEKILPRQGHSLDCGHTHCRTCVVSYLEASITNGLVRNLKCPEEGCDNLFKEDDIYQLCSPLMYEKYRRFAASIEVALNAALKYCPRPNCGRIVEGSSSAPHLVCSCGFHFCFNCGEGWHEGSCTKNYEKLYNVWASGKNLQRCPRCNIRVEKAGGCNHITCAFCKYEWCWICGQHYRYGHFDNLFFGCPMLQFTSHDWSLCGIFFYLLVVLLLWPIILPIVSMLYMMSKCCANRDLDEQCKCVCCPLFLLVGLAVACVMFIPTFCYRIYTVHYALLRLCRGN